MKLHAGTLEELELNYQFPESLYKFVFGKLKRLKTLKLDGPAIPRDSGFYERLEVNRSVTSLKLQYVSKQALALKGLIDRLPNIETLELP